MSARKQKDTKKGAYSLANTVDSGTVINDIYKNSWITGGIIGQGGFGSIYLVNQWKKEHRLKYLGIPRYICSGSFNSNRYLIMDRFKSDLEKAISTSSVSPVSLIRVAINLLNALEYVHSKDYVHADIKASNLLFHANIEEVYLADFGMARLFRVGGKHNLPKPDKKCRHNGTLEFCSRDAHNGLLPSRRGDLEILMYNLIHWLARTVEVRSEKSYSVGLPWGHLIPDPKTKKIVPEKVKNQVCELKEKSWNNREEFVRNSGLSDISGIMKFATYISQLDYADEPDYNKLRDILKLSLTSVANNNNKNSDNNTTSTSITRSNPKKISKPSVADNNNTPTRPVSSSKKPKKMPTPASSRIKSPFPAPVSSPPSQSPIKPASATVSDTRNKRSRCRNAALVSLSDKTKLTASNGSIRIDSPSVYIPTTRRRVNPPASLAHLFSSSSSSDNSDVENFDVQHSSRRLIFEKTPPTRRLPSTNTPLKDVVVSKKSTASPGIGSLKHVDSKQPDPDHRSLVSPTRVKNRRSGFCQTSPELLLIAKRDAMRFRKHF